MTSWVVAVEAICESTANGFYTYYGCDADSFSGRYSSVQSSHPHVHMHMDMDMCMCMHMSQGLKPQVWNVSAVVTLCLQPMWTCRNTQGVDVSAAPYVPTAAVHVLYKSVRTHSKTSGRRVVACSS
eukprot:7238757-Prymnesium_polylepis.1